MARVVRTDPVMAALLLLLLPLLTLANQDRTYERKLSSEYFNSLLDPVILEIIMSIVK